MGEEPKEIAARCKYRLALAIDNINRIWLFSVDREGVEYLVLLQDVVIPVSIPVAVTFEDFVLGPVGSQTMTWPVRMLLVIQWMQQMPSLSMTGW